MEGGKVMEVNGLTAFSITTPARPAEAFRISEHGSENPVPVRNPEIKIEDVTMDLEEMKNFLFMMLRGGAITLEKDSSKIGTLVNRLA